MNASSEMGSESSERITFRKSHEFDERNSFPDQFDSIGYASKKKNTPLKSTYTKTKESLMQNKHITPKKADENLKFPQFDMYIDDHQVGDTRHYKYTPGNSNFSLTHS